MPPATEQAAPATAPAALRAAMFMLYADPKAGKTGCCLRAFPRALMIGQQSAIRLVAESICGFTPQPWQLIESVQTLPQLVQFLSDDKVGLKSREWQAAIRSYGVDSIVVDDFSQLATRSVIIWGHEDKGQKDKYYKYNRLDEHLEWVSFLLRDLGLLCALSAHKLEPKYDLNEKSRTYGQLVAMGAPEVPSAKQVQAVPGWVDFVAPVRKGPSLDPWWPRVIAVDPSEAGLWIAGDRNSVCWAETPANLREILLAAPTPYHLPRLPGLEWQDDVAESVCGFLKSGEPVFDVMKRMFTHYAAYAVPNTSGERHVQWACQDGIARHTIRQHQALGVMGQISPSLAAPPPPPPTPEVPK